MTEIIEDNVNINLQIGTTEDDEPIKWDLIDGEVVLSQVATPNYVDMVVAPQPQYIEDIDDQLQEVDEVTGGNAISALVGSQFRLEADNDLVAVRNDLSDQTDVSDIEEDSLLFQGRLANISPMGNGLYEAIAYDPGQQAFNIGAESGSIINQKLDFTGSSSNPDFVEPEDLQDNDVEGSNSLQATRLLELIVNEVGITDFEIELTDEGVTADGEPAGDAPPEETFATTQELSDGPFKSGVVPVKDALDYAREQCSAEWWFDKSGTFHFGKPNSRNYELSLIKDTSAGITTPPYQSVEVVGSSTATSDGWNSTNQVQDDDKKIVKRAIIARPSAGGTQANKIIILDPTDEQFEQFQPPFKYVNVELSTDEQVQNAAIKVADELAKQQASGTITTVGFPEVVPFDGLVMPNSDSQPMGGQTYGVYKVTHRLNVSDGFITKIQVAGPTNILQSVDVERDEEEGEDGETQFTGDRIATSTDREVYTNDGERRAFKPGAGEGD